MNQFISNPILSQKLLFPYEKEVTVSDKMEWLNNSTMLNRLGFDTEFQDNIMQINAVPSVLQEENINDCLDTILENISFRDIEKGDIAHILIKSIARSSSQKKNVFLTNEESEILVEDLFQCSEHTFTPSGKKIIETLTIEEIANKF